MQSSNSTDRVLTKVLNLLAVSATVSILTVRAAIRWHSRRHRNRNRSRKALGPEQSPVIDTFTSQNRPYTPIEDEYGANAASKPTSRADPYDARPRTDYLSWDDYFMAVAFLSAQRSKDPAKQVGACIVDSNNIICGIGYNGFPRGCPDDELPWAKLSQDGDPLGTKYPYVCHAEMNAVLNKNGASVAGAKLYVTMFPCNECAKLLIQAGIREIVFHEDKAQPKSGTPSLGGGGFKLSQQYAASRRLLQMAGVQVRQHRFQRPFSLTLTNHPNSISSSANGHYNSCSTDETELNGNDEQMARIENHANLNSRLERKTLKFDDV